MTDTGITRPVDDLGRIVIPSEIRKRFGINVKDLMSIHVEGDRIVLQKEHDACALCGGTENINTRVHDRGVCDDCYNKIVNKHMML